MALFAKKSNIMDYANQTVWDLLTDERIKDLHPQLQPIAKAFINKAKAQGINLRITQSYRSPEEQTKDYAQGRTTPGKIITNAKALESYHNYRLAFDVVPIVAGKANYNADWLKIGNIGKSVGLEWGGDFKSIKDNPHFQKSFNNSIAMLQDKYKAGKLNNGFVIV